MTEREKRPITPKGILMDYVANGHVAAIIADEDNVQSAPLLRAAADKINRFPPSVRAQIAASLAHSQISTHEFWNATRLSAASRLTSVINMEGITLPEPEVPPQIQPSEPQSNVTGQPTQPESPSGKLSGKRLDEQNAVLEYLGEHKHTERWEIAEKTGLSLSKVEGVLRALQKSGVVAKETKTRTKHEGHLVTYTIADEAVREEYRKALEIEVADTPPSAAAIDVSEPNDAAINASIAVETSPVEEPEVVWSGIISEYAEKSAGQIAKEAGGTRRAVESAIFRARERGEQVSYKRPERVPEEVLERRARQGEVRERQERERAELVNNITTLHSQDVPEAEIAERLGVSVGVVRSKATALREQGAIEKRHAGPLPADQVASFRATLTGLWGQGLTVAQIKERVGPDLAGRVNHYLGVLREEGAIPQRKVGTRLSEEGARQRDEVRQLIASGVDDPEVIRDRTGIRLDKVRRHIDAVQKEQPEQQSEQQPAEKVETSESGGLSEAEVATHYFGNGEEPATTQPGGEVDVFRAYGMEEANRPEDGPTSPRHVAPEIEE